MDSNQQISIDFQPKEVNFGCLKEELLYCHNVTITLKNIDLFDLRAYSQKPRAILKIHVPESINILSVEPIDTHKYVLMIGVCRSIPEEWKKEKSRLELFDSEDRIHGESSGKYHKFDLNEELIFKVNDADEFVLRVNAEICDSLYYHEKSLKHSFVTKLFSSRGDEFLENNYRIDPRYQFDDETLLLIFPTTANIMYFEERKQSEEEQQKVRMGRDGEKEVHIDIKKLVSEKVEYLDKRREKYMPRSVDVLKLSVYELRLNRIHPYNYTTILLDRTQRINSKLDYLKQINEKSVIEECRQIVLEKEGRAGIPFVRTPNVKVSNKGQLVNEWKERLGLVELGISHEETSRRRNYHNIRYSCCSSPLGMAVSSFMSPLGFQKDEVFGSSLLGGCYSGTVVYYDGTENTAVFTRTIYDLLFLGWDFHNFGRLHKKKKKKEEEKIIVKVSVLTGFFKDFMDEEDLCVFDEAIQKMKDFGILDEKVKEKRESKIEQVTSEYVRKKYEIIVEQQQQQQSSIEEEEEEEEDEDGKKRNCIDEETKQLFDSYFQQNEDDEGFLIPTTKFSACIYGEDKIVSNGIVHTGTDVERLQLENSFLVSISGFHAVNIPVGFNGFHKLPVGITCVGRNKKCLFKIIKVLGMIF